ncbi:MAG: hypothetical protein ACPGWR_05710 [Ardenticatenaceae bacterium]
MFYRDGTSSRGVFYLGRTSSRGVFYLGRTSSRGVFYPERTSRDGCSTHLRSRAIFWRTTESNTYGESCEHNKIA